MLPGKHISLIRMYMLMLVLMYVQCITCEKMIQTDACQRRVSRVHWPYRISRFSHLFCFVLMLMFECEQVSERVYACRYGLFSDNVATQQTLYHPFPSKLPHSLCTVIISDPFAECECACKLSASRSDHHESNKLMCPKLNVSHHSHKCCIYFGYFYYRLPHLSAEWCKTIEIHHPTSVLINNNNNDKLICDKSTNDTNLCQVIEIKWKLKGNGHFLKNSSLK